MEDTVRRARRTFSEEFKREAAELAIKVGNGSSAPHQIQQMKVIIAALINLNVVILKLVFLNLMSK